MTGQHSLPFLIGFIVGLSMYSISLDQAGQAVENGTPYPGREQLCYVRAIHLFLRRLSNFLNFP